MLSLQIIVHDRGYKIIDIITKANISKQSYYTTVDAKRNVSDSILDKLGKTLNIPEFRTLYLLDRLYQSKIQINDLQLPESIPGRIRELIYKKHPLFINGKK